MTFDRICILLSQLNEIFNGSLWSQCRRELPCCHFPAAPFCTHSKRSWRILQIRTVWEQKAPIPISSTRLHLQKIRIQPLFFRTNNESLDYTNRHQHQQHFERQPKFSGTKIQHITMYVVLYRDCLILSVFDKFYAFPILNQPSFMHLGDSPKHFSRAL